MSKALLARARNSLKYRLRYFLFRDGFLPSTSISSLLFEQILRCINRSLNFKGFGLLVGLKAIDQTSLWYPNLAIEEALQRSWAVILQGGFESRAAVEYAVETVKIFRLQAPSLPMILVTFSNEFSQLAMGRLESLNVHTLFVEDPGTLPPPYAKNLLRQIHTTSAGVDFAEKIGAEYCVKLRVDQRIGNLHCLKLAESLIKNDFFKPTTPNVHLNSRIIGSSLNSYSSIPLFMSDMLQFGTTRNLRIFWQNPGSIDLQSITNEMLDRMGEPLAKWIYHPEVWLVSRYILTAQHAFKDLVEANKFFWGSCAGIMDSVSTNHLWAKTDDFFISNYKSIKWFDESFSDQFIEMRFIDWIAMQSFR